MVYGLRKEFHPYCESPMAKVIWINALNIIFNYHEKVQSLKAEIIVPIATLKAVVLESSRL